MQSIHFEELKIGMPGLSRSIGQYLAEAGAYCLAASGHHSGVVLKVERVEKELLQLEWDEIIDQQVVRSWNDQQEATEYGATAIAVLLLKQYTDYTIVERSFKGTGFDYWLGTGKYNENVLPFEQRTARLEVSGIWKTSLTNTLAGRVRRKIRQVEQGGYSDIPAVIIVVEFHTPKSKMKTI